jgi:hypothetical protein
MPRCLLSQRSDSQAAVAPPPLIAGPRPSSPAVALGPAGLHPRLLGDLYSLPLFHGTGRPSVFAVVSSMCCSFVERKEVHADPGGRALHDPNRYVHWRRSGRISQAIDKTRCTVVIWPSRHRRATMVVPCRSRQLVARRLLRHEHQEVLVGQEVGRPHEPVTGAAHFRADLLLRDADLARGSHCGIAGEVDDRHLPSRPQAFA